MNFVTTTQLPELDAPVLLQDLARVFRQLSVQFVRVTVVDMASLTAPASWSISEAGEVTEAATDRALDAVYDDAGADVAGLVGASTEQTLQRQLSPGRWAYAWRLDSVYAIFAETQYRERHRAVSEIELALLRLVCSASIQRAEAASRGEPALNATPMWPHVDRRAPQRPSRAVILATALAALAAVLAGWLALAALPQADAALAAQQTELAQQRSRADATMTASLAAALATGDYGEAQTELTHFRELGYFRSAVVTNTRQQAVAMEGEIEGLRIGDAVTANYAAQARVLPLALGSSAQGQLLLVSGGASSATPMKALQVAAALALVVSLGSAMLLGWRLRRR